MMPIVLALTALGVWLAIYYSGGSPVVKFWSILGGSIFALLEIIAYFLPEDWGGTTGSKLDDHYPKGLSYDDDEYGDWW